MKKKAAFVIAILLTLGAGTSSSSENRRYITHPDGAIRNSSFACAVGELYLSNIYGAAQIKAQRPFKAHIVDGVWTVSGTLPSSAAYGGVAIIRLRQQDGALLGFTHTK
jgi:hypothetical protein